MASESTPSPALAFPGFPDFRSNVTFVPIQFFTVVLPNSSRGCARIVGYMLRKLLGWVDETGEPTAYQVEFSCGQLAKEAGVSRDAIAAALAEALENRFLKCVQRPHRDRLGKPAQTAIYTLCWDSEDRYTDSLKEFRGFCYPASALMTAPDNPGSAPRAKSARKNIPNAFFDYLLPRERLSVIRVVGLLLFYSIQWGPGGERRVPVSRSIGDLSGLTRLSPQHVHEAVMEAIRQGYIQRLDPGRFDPNAGKENRAGTYSIRWCSGNPASVPAGVPAGNCVGENPDRPEKVNGEPAGKGERHQPEKVNGNRPEKVNGISIKTEHKTDQTTAADAGSPKLPVSDAGDAAAVELLVKAGFSPDYAKRLAQRRPLEVIRRQIDWLPLRNTSRNRLGLLRRAIEQDWAKPEAGGSPTHTTMDLRPARTFAVRYYAAYHGYTGEPATEPFAKDLHVAAAFVERLLALEGDENQVPEWGRGFGQLIRAKLQNDPHAKPYLSCMLGLYGNEFLRQRQREVAARQKSALGKAREGHQTAFAAEYDAYLRQTEIALQKGSPDLYAAFLDDRRKTRRTMTGGLFLASADTIARFDSEASRLAAFAEFFRKHPQHLVLDFWEWDARHNPRRFGAHNTTTFQETHA